MTHEERGQRDSEAAVRLWREGEASWQEEQRHPVRAFSRLVVAAMERGKRAQIIEASQRVIEAALPEPVNVIDLRRRMFTR